jgi:hypothetical protein
LRLFYEIKENVYDIALKRPFLICCDGFSVEYYFKPRCDVVVGGNL